MRLTQDMLVDIIVDIKQGIEDSAIMEKYEISQKFLEALYRRLARTGIFTKAGYANRQHPNDSKINVSQIIEDVSSGMTDEGAVKKHRLAVPRLQGMSDELLRSGEPMPTKISHQNKPSPNDVLVAGPGSARLSFRHDLDFTLPIFEEKDPETLGIVVNITEAGVGVRGISANAGERKTLVVPADEFFDVGRLRAQATCRWSARDPWDGEPIAGFEFEDLSRTGVNELRRLIQLTQTMKGIETIDYSESEADGEARCTMRYTSPFPVPVHDAVNRQNKGKVLNVSEMGLAVEGLTCEEGEKKSLVIPAYHHGRVSFKSIVVIAECRWVRPTEGRGPISGFKIIDRTANSLKELKELVSLCASAG